MERRSEPVCDAATAAVAATVTRDCEWSVGRSGHSGHAPGTSSGGHDGVRMDRRSELWRLAPGQRGVRGHDGGEWIVGRSGRQDRAVCHRRLVTTGANWIVGRSCVIRSTQTSGAPRVTTGANWIVGRSG